jgi:hypothetical protein
MTAFCNKETFEMFGKQQSAETFRKENIVGSSDGLNKTEN